MNCYVLVGGRSTRLGTSKAALFLDRVAAAARPVFDRVIAVDRSQTGMSGPHTRGADIPVCATIFPHMCGADIPVCATIFEDAHEDEAPIFGVRRALDHAQAKCFILAVDYPLITSELLRDWSLRFATSSANMLVPRSGGYPHVLCAGYSHLLLPVITARIVRRQYDLRSIAADAEFVDHDGAELLNVNTIEELEAYERQRLLSSR